MGPRDMKDIKVDDEVIVAPKPYRHLPKVFDDYDVNAKVFNIKKQLVIDKFKLHVACEEDFAYSYSTSYKGSFSYNRDD